MSRSLPFFVIAVFPSQSHRLTTDDAVKTALDVCIGTSGTPLEQFRPGDAFAIVVENPKPEVDLLLERLFPEDSAEEAENGNSASSKPSPDSPFSLAILPKTSKIKAEIPSFIPEFVTPRWGAVTETLAF